MRPLPLTPADIAETLATLETYGRYRPTGLDAPGAFLPDRGAWLVLPVTRTRDSGTLESSNFRVAAAAMAEVDPAGELFEVHRFGHWGCGWYEIMIVNPAAPGEVLAMVATIARKLDNYPVLDENDYSDLESERAAEVWAGMSLRDRMAVCARYRVSIFAARRDDVPESPTGELNSYLAGE